MEFMAVNFMKCYMTLMITKKNGEFYIIIK